MTGGYSGLPLDQPATIDYDCVLDMEYVPALTICEDNVWTDVTPGGLFPAFCFVRDKMITTRSIAGSFSHLQQLSMQNILSANEELGFVQPLKDKQ